MGRVHLTSTGERTGFWRDATRLQPDFSTGVPNAPDAAVANGQPIHSFGLQLEPGAVSRANADWQERHVATIQRTRDPGMKLSDGAWPSKTMHPPYGTLKGWPLRDDPTAAVALANTVGKRDSAAALRLSDAEGRLQPDRFNGAEIQSGSGIFPVVRAAYDSPSPRDAVDPGFLADGVMYGTERSSLPHHESRAWPMGPAGSWPADLGEEGEGGEEEEKEEDGSAEFPQSWVDNKVGVLSPLAPHSDPSRQSVYKELRPLLQTKAEIGPPASFRGLAPLDTAASRSSSDSGELTQLSIVSAQHAGCVLSNRQLPRRQLSRQRRQRRRWQQGQGQQPDRQPDAVALGPLVRPRKEWSETWISSGGDSVRAMQQRRSGSGAGSPVFDAPEEHGGRGSTTRSSKTRWSSSSSSSQGSRSSSVTDGGRIQEAWLSPSASAAVDSSLFPNRPMRANVRSQSVLGGLTMHKHLQQPMPVSGGADATEAVDKWLRTGFCTGGLGAGDQARMLQQTLATVLATPSVASVPRSSRREFI